MERLNSNNHSPIKSLLAIVLGCTVIFLFTGSNWLLYLSIVIICVGLISNRLTQGIHYLWMKIALVLGFIVPKIVLILIFYCVLFPLSLLSKLFGRKDPLHLKNNTKTTFITVHKTFDKQSFENPW